MFFVFLTVILHRMQFLHDLSFESKLCIILIYTLQHFCCLLTFLYIKFWGIMLLHIVRCNFFCQVINNFIVAPHDAYESGSVWLVHKCSTCPHGFCDIFHVCCDCLSHQTFITKSDFWCDSTIDVYKCKCIVMSVLKPL